MPIRYYFHGDASEERSGTYYCAICDTFEAEAHFEDERHIRGAKFRLDRTKRGLKNLRGSFPQKYSRPASAESLFKHRPKLLKPVKPVKPATSRFYRWLLRQAGRDDPVGDVGAAAKGDQFFPVNTESRSKLRSHLRRSNADRLALVALDEALQEFKKLGAPRDGIPPKLRYEILRRDGCRCQLCGAMAEDSESIRLEVDHKVAVANGGTNDPENLWVLCRECNRGKGAGDL